MTLYEILGIPKTSTMDEIHKAYVQLARQHHPDLQGGAESEEFRRIKHAHDILHDPESRMIYDETGYVKGDSDDTLKIAAVGLLRELAVEVLRANGPDADIVSELRRLLYDRLANVFSKIQQFEEQLSNTVSAMERFESRWSKGAPQIKAALLGMLRGGSEQAKMNLAKAKLERRPIELAIEMLADAQYDMPAPEPISFSTGNGSFGGVSWIIR